MTTPIKPTRTKSSTTGLYDLLSSTPEAESADRNTPKIREDCQTPHPAHPPPLPPKTKTVISMMSPASANSGVYHNLTCNELKVKPPDTNGEKTPSPLPSPRPKRPPPPPIPHSSSEYERALPQTELRPKPSHSGYDDVQRSPRPPRPERSPSNTASRSPSGLETMPPELPQPSHSGYDDVQRSPCPPRPERSPSNTASRSPSGLETMPPELPQPSHSGYDDVQRSPRPPRPERSPSNTASRSPSGLETMPPQLPQPSHSGYDDVQRSYRPPRPERSPSNTVSCSYETMPPQLGLLPQMNNQNTAAHPPPLPPKTQAVISMMSPASANSGVYHNLTCNELKVKPPDTNGEKTPSPLPAPRPKRPPPPPIPHSSSEYERALPQIELRPKPSHSGYDDVQRSPRPPRPERPPSNSASRSPSGLETMPPQLGLLPQGSEGYDDRSIRSSPNSGPPAGYGSPSRTSTMSYKHRPPPPSFDPPPPPPYTRSQSAPIVSYTNQTPTVSYTNQTGESLYSEIDEYLEILPEENELQFQPSFSVYRPNCTLGLPAESLYQNYSPQTRVTEDVEDFECLLRWMRTVGYLENAPPSLDGLSIVQETREFNQRAQHVKKGLRLFNYLLIKRNDALRGHISEFNHMAGLLDKNKSKKMSIVGSTAGAVGGVAAIVGIALAPVTMGVSLIATAVGAGLVATGGSVGAKAVMANKKANKVDRKRMEKAVDDYRADIADVERCLSLIRSGMDQLRQHNVCRLQGAGLHPEALRTLTVAHHLHRNPVYQAVGTTGVSSESLLQMFAKTIDQYFTEKDGQKLKKVNEAKFACQVRLLAKGLQDELNELNKVWETFTFAANV